MTVDKIAIPGVETAGPDTAVEVLAATMADANVGSVVIEEDGRAVGIVTDRDLVVGVLAPGADAEGLTARDVMTPNPSTIPQSAGVLELTNEMCRAEVRRMPVVDGEGEIVGIVTLDDLFVLLVAELQNLAGVINAETPVY